MTKKDHPKKRLGQTDLYLSPIGLGTWQFGGNRGPIGNFWQPPPDERITEIVKTTINHGINWFDTAEAYGDGDSERRLSTALQQLNTPKDSVYIADKWWPKQRKASSLLETISQRKDCLQGYPISLYQIHWPESQSWLRTEMKALAQLVEEGHVRAVGLCNYSSKLLRKAYKHLARHSVTLASVQARYNLLQRDIEDNDLLSTAKDLGISVIAWSPLEQGLLTGRFHNKNVNLNNVTSARRKMINLTNDRVSQTEKLLSKLKNLAAKHNCSISQISLAWILHNPNVDCFAIPGASSTEQAIDNALSMQVQLSENEVGLLSELSVQCK